MEMNTVTINLTKPFEILGNKEGTLHVITNNGEKWIDINSDGKVIHYRDDTRYEQWNKYDENGNCVEVTDTNGCFITREYSDDNEIKKMVTKNPHNLTDDVETYSDGLLTHWQDCCGVERSYEYNKAGKCIKTNHNIDNIRYEYDAKGNIIKTEALDKDNNVVYYEMIEYDEKGRWIHSINSTNVEIHLCYDDNNRMIKAYGVNSDGISYVSRYDKYGREIYYSDSANNKRITKYDKDGRCIYHKAEMPNMQKE